jgi:hypothetical protein
MSLPLPTENEMPGKVSPRPADCVKTSNSLTRDPRPHGEIHGNKSL